MKKFTRWVTFGGLALLGSVAGGCANLPSKHVLLKPGGTNVNAHALQDPGLKRFMEQQLNRPLAGWPLHKWDDTTLTLAAWYFNPRLNEVRSQWERAEASRIEAAGRPKLATPEVRSFPDGMLSEFSAGIVRQAIAQALGGPRVPPVATPDNVAGKRLSRTARAEHSADSLRLHLQAVAWQVRTEVRTNLMTYVAAQRGESLLVELETTYAKLVEAEQRRSAADSMPSLQLSLLRLQLAQVRLVLIQTRLAKMDTRERLAHSLNVHVSALFEVNVAFDFSQVAAGILTVPRLRWRALQGRPDILLALADYREAENGLRAEIAKRRLAFQFPAACHWNRDRNQWVIRLDLGLPDGRAGRALGKAEARRVAAAAHLLSLQSEIIDEVERSAAVYRMTDAEVAGIDALIGAILQKQDGFESGEDDELAPEITDQPELLFRLQLLAAGFAKMEAQVKLQNALGSLEDALQQPLAVPARRQPQSLPLKPERDEMQPSTHIL